MKHSPKLVSYQRWSAILEQLAFEEADHEIRERLLILAASFASAQVSFNGCEPAHSGPEPLRLNAAGHMAFKKGMPMRDLLADWKRWSRAERLLAVIITLLVLAMPIGILMSWNISV